MTDHKKFSGSYVALVTPFTADNEIDVPAYQRLIDWHIEQGTHGLVPCGTTGETPTLSHDEHMALITACVEASDGRVPVIAGAGSNATSEAISLAKHAENIGADAILTVVPYYNKPSQEGIYNHFKAVHDATDIPLVLYDVPGRTVASMTVDTVTKLAKLPRVVGIKDAAPDLERPLAMRTAIGDDFALLSGEDSTVTAYLAQGGDGCISVTANVAPKLCSELHTAWQKGDLKTCFEIRNKLLPLHQLMFAAPNPTPAKYAVSKLGHCDNIVRSPMTLIDDALQKRLDEALKTADLI